MHAGFLERSDLVVHQRDQRADDDGHALAAPLFHGRMLVEAGLRSDDTVLLVSCGSGYLAALLEGLVAKVTSISAADAAAAGAVAAPAIAQDGAPGDRAWWKLSALTQPRAGAVVVAAGLVLGRDYPRPIVDHAEARERTLARYAVVKARSAP